MPTLHGDCTSRITGGTTLARVVGRKMSAIDRILPTPRLLEIDEIDLASGIRSSATATFHACRWGARAALCTLAGIVLSGPFALILLANVHPQPPWKDAELFARHYHPIQSLPYLGGLLLVGGMVALMASLQSLAHAKQRAMATTALAFTAAFAALVFFNYIVQTTFVPNLARHYAPEGAAVIAAFSMVNPSSLAWAIEMWAYGFLGVATLLIAPVFSGTTIERVAAISFIANGGLSCVTALWTAADPSWMMTTFGLVAYTVWNILIFAMVTVAFVALRRRMGQTTGSTSSRVMTS
jgi:hypothetical protein